IVGQIIGSGIFASPGPLLVQSGSVGMALVIWLLAGVLSMTGAYCYAELGTMIPASGGEYQYLLQAFGPLTALTYSWTMVMLCNGIALAAISLVFAQYVCNLFADLSTRETAAAVPGGMVKLVAVSAIMTVALVNCISRRSGSRVQDIFTAAKLGAIAIIVLIGAGWAVSGRSTLENFHEPFQGTTTEPLRYSTATYLALFSYVGWNNLNYAAGELKNPRRNLPLAITISLLLVIACYLLANLAYLVVLPLDVVRTSNTVAMDFGMYTLGKFGKYFMAVMVAMSSFGAINGLIVAGSRVTLASTSAHAIFPRALARLHPTRETPVRALLFVGVVASAWACTGDFAQLANVVMFLFWISYLATVLGLLRMRISFPDAPRAFRVWTPVAVVFCIVTAFLVIAPLLDASGNIWMYVACICGSLLAVPLYWVRVQPPAFLRRHR
ncbi:amino acid/polyamine transporter I, partial [Thamnocephalis sphaerospora]